MFPTQFLSSYCIFSAAVSAFRNTPEETRLVPEQREVKNAFKKATQGMSKKDEAAFIQYVQRLFQQPKNFESDRFDRYFAEHKLDHALAKSGGSLIEEGAIIIAGDFITATGISQETLAKKLRERLIFKMPDWVYLVWGDDYFPAFFADSQYDRCSLEAVSKALRAYNGIRKYRFFTASDPNLGNRTPLEAIGYGDLGLVLTAVKVFHKRSPPVKLP